MEKNQYNVNGKKEGLWEEYWGNGEVSTRCTYKDGLIDGRYEYYYPNGTLNSVEEYIGGKKDGIVLRYNHRTRNILEIRFNNRDGLADDLYERFFVSGKIREIGYYKLDECVGLWERRNSKGKVIQREYYYI
jgi:antitoxin component YwqK of YwqJK toxin-antitoxin module